MAYARKNCKMCRKRYTPKSGTQKYCAACGPLVFAQAKRRFHNSTREKENERSVRKGVCHAGDAITPVPEKVLAAWRFEQLRHACAIAIHLPDRGDDIPTDMQTIGPSIYQGERNPAKTCKCGTKPGGRCVCREKGVIG